MDEPRGLPLLVLVIIDHYENLWSRPVTSEEVAWSLFPLVNITAIHAAVATLVATRHVAPISDAWHALPRGD